MKSESLLAVCATEQDREPLPRVDDGIALRRVTVADLPAFQAYRCDEDVGRYQGWTAMSDAEAALFLAEMNRATLFEPGRWCQIGIADAVSQALIGDVGLFLSDDAQRAEIGFTLRPQSQGQGRASAAVRATISLIFEHTSVLSVQGITDARNVSSIHLLGRTGMQRLETRDAVFRGERCSEYVYAISRDIWLANGADPIAQFE